LKLITEKILDISLTFSKIFKKLNQELSKYFHIEKIGITDINPQISPTTNLFLDKFTQSIYEKIYPQITMGISEIIEIQIMEKIVSIIIVN
jgi:hypothetical protein